MTQMSGTHVGLQRALPSLWPWGQTVAGNVFLFTFKMTIFLLSTFLDVELSVFCWVFLASNSVLCGKGQKLDLPSSGATGKVSMSVQGPIPFSGPDDTRRYFPVLT
jgi:hypothetical protein